MSRSARSFSSAIPIPTGQRSRRDSGSTTSARSWGGRRTSSTFLSSNSPSSIAEAKKQEALHAAFAASRGGDVETLERLLLSENLDVNEADHAGRTCLHLSCEGSEVETVRCLLQTGARVNAEDRRGNTPLHWASKYSNQDVIRMLLSFGADVLKKNSEGQSPTAVAQAKGRREAASLLKTYASQILAQPQAPEPPRLVENGPHSLTVVWKCPEPSGPNEFPVTSYDIRYSVRGLFMPWVNLTEVCLDDCFQIKGLRLGTDYVMQVRARNRNGAGPYSTKSKTMRTSDVLEDPKEAEASPILRSESLNTMQEQRDQAEARASELSLQRENAEQAMLRIEKEREDVERRLLQNRRIVTQLRGTLEERDATIADLEARLRAMQSGSCSGDPLRDQDVDKSEATRTFEILPHMSKLQNLEGDVRRAEMRARAREEQLEALTLQLRSVCSAREKAEKDVEVLRNERESADARCAAMREQRDNAEESLKSMQALVGQLERQRDAAEVLVEQLEQTSGDAQAAAEEIVKLKEELKVARNRLGEVAGISKKYLSLEKAYDIANVSLQDLEEQLERRGDEINELRRERDIIRSQRDTAEENERSSRDARNAAENAAAKMRRQIENLVENGATRNEKCTGRIQNTGNETTALAGSTIKQKTSDAELEMCQCLSDCAAEVFALLNSHKSWVSQIDDLMQRPFLQGVEDECKLEGKQSSSSNSSLQAHQSTFLS